MTSDGGHGRFAYRITKDGRVRISHDGRHVVTVAGPAARALIPALQGADPEAEQLLLARATGNFKRGNERAGSSRGAQPVRRATDAE
jgi:hypothetical protein